MENLSIEIQDLKQLLAELIQSQQKMSVDLAQSRKETDARFKETDAQFKEIAARFKETDAKFKETDAKFKETDAKFKETDAKFKETEARFKETDARFKETDKRIKQAFDLFEGQWGKLMESLIEGDLLRLLQERGIKVRDMSTRRKGNYQGTSYEFDIIAHNGHEIVIVEVKTTLRVRHVKKFLDRLKKAKIWMSEYKNFNIYGAIAFLKAEEESDTFAQSKKLFAIRATGDSASIINEMEFVPRAF